MSMEIPRQIIAMTIRRSGSRFTSRPRLAMCCTSSAAAATQSAVRSTDCDCAALGFLCGARVTSSSRTTHSDQPGCIFPRIENRQEPWISTRLASLNFESTSTMPKRTAEELAARAEKKAAKAARLEKKAAKAARKAEKEKATGTRRSPRLAPATLHALPPLRSGPAFGDLSRSRRELRSASTASAARGAR